MVLLGEKLERPTYTILHTIQEGNSAECHEAIHDLYDRRVVQKTISLLGLTDSAVRSEPALLNRLRHDHLVTVWEAQWDPDPARSSAKLVTFVMPYYEGKTVHRALSEGHRFSIGEAIQIACGTLDALHYLHVEKGLLHRDVKPSNIMLDETRTYPYLGDLGSAAYIEGTGDADAQAGTPLYRPPEAHLGRVDVRGDIYGVGMVLLEMLNGPLPYADIVSSDLYKRLDAGKPPVQARLLRPGPHVPDALSQLVRKMIDPDPNRRPSSASDALAALEDIKHMDWRASANGESWEGRFPPSAGTRARVFRIVKQMISSGRYAGQIKLTAAWRRSDTLDWRGLASLTRRVAPDDPTALRAFFRTVESAAAQMPAA